MREFESFPVKNCECFFKTFLSHSFIFYRDWRGVRDRAEIDIDFKESLRGATGKDFMTEILYRWYNSTNCKRSNLNCLLKILEEIDRFDIYDDVIESFRADAQIFKEKGLQVVRKDFKLVDIITEADRPRASQGLKLYIYDAIILYSEDSDEDYQFAVQIYDFLSRNNLRICTRNDLVGGLTLEYHACMDLIKKRCRRVIVIVSSALVEGSHDEKFLIKFAQDNDITKNTRKLIPVQREPGHMNEHLSILFHLKYFRHGGLFDFWKKLLDAVTYYANLETSLDTDEYEYVPYKHEAISDAQAVPSKAPLESISDLSKAIIPTVVQDLNKGILKNQNGFALNELKQVQAVQNAPNPPTTELSDTDRSLVSNNNSSSSNLLQKVKKKSAIKRASKSLEKLVKKSLKISDKKKVAEPTND